MEQMKAISQAPSKAGSFGDLCEGSGQNLALLAFGKQTLGGNGGGFSLATFFQKMTRLQGGTPKPDQGPTPLHNLMQKSRLGAHSIRHDRNDLLQALDDPRLTSRMFSSRGLRPFRIQ